MGIDLPIRILTIRTDLGVILAYENMPGPKGSWNVNPKNLYLLDFPFTKITFDVTHLEEEMNELRFLTQDAKDLMSILNDVEYLI